jgi:hypothetical protein
MRKCQTCGTPISTRKTFCSDCSCERKKQSKLNYARAQREGSRQPTGIDPWLLVRGDIRNNTMR